MKDKIVLVAGHIGAGRTTVIAEAHAHKHQNDVIIMTPEQAKQEAMFSKSEPYIYKRQPPLLPMFQEKQFVCKGKHQYRDIKGKWTCQCGKSL